MLGGFANGEEKRIVYESVYNSITYRQNKINSMSLLNKHAICVCFGNTNQGMLLSPGDMEQHICKDTADADTHSPER